MKPVLSSILILAVQGLGAQDIGAYLDYRDYFFAFDRGTFKELETLPPRVFAAGGNYLAYASSNGDLKIYDGELRTIDRNIAVMPTVTDHYLGYVSAAAFKIWDGDSLRTLCISTGAAITEDSLAAWYDDRQQTLNVHYRGESMVIEDALMENPVQSWKAGDNTLAWVNKQTNEFKVFYRGEVLVLATLVRDMPFAAGLDMVAFQDPSDKGFKLFHKGVVIDLEAIMPREVRMGRGTCVWVDVSGALKAFEGGSTHTIMEIAPLEHFVMDSLVVMKDGSQLKVFQNGATSTVVQYMPQVWKASWGTLAWIDTDGTLKAWRNGLTETVMQREPVKELSIDRGLITLTLTAGGRRVWWKGRIYEP